jgi:hypothetical protein
LPLQALHPFLVAGVKAHVLVHAEPGVLPTPDILDHFLPGNRPLVISHGWGRLVNQVRVNPVQTALIAIVLLAFLQIGTFFYAGART